MTALVTGAGGFIGQNLVTELASRGIQVRALARRPIEALSSTPNVEVCIGDLMDETSVATAMEGCTQIYHLAAFVSNWAKDMSIFRQVNVDGFATVLKLAKENNIQRIVLTSTAGTFGPQTDSSLVDETAKPPVSEMNIYESTKLEAEELALEHVNQGMDIVIVNPTRIFGPGEIKKSNVAGIMQRYVQGKWKVLLGDGKAVGNYGYVTDVVKGHILAMEKGKTGEKYILGGENLSYADFFDGIADVSGKHYRLFKLWAPLAYTVTAFMAAFSAIFRTPPLLTPKWITRYLQNRGNDISKSINELGYQITPYKTAVKQTLAELD